MSGSAPQSFDAVLESRVGAFGRGQLLLVLTASMSHVPMAAILMLMVFTSQDPIAAGAWNCTGGGAASAAAATAAAAATTTNSTALQAWAVHDWRLLTLLCAALAVAFLATAPLVPESPRWLAATGKRAAAAAVLARLAALNGRGGGGGGGGGSGEQAGGIGRGSAAGGDGGSGRGRDGGSAPGRGSGVGEGTVGAQQASGGGSGGSSGGGGGGSGGSGGGGSAPGSKGGGAAEPEAAAGASTECRAGDLEAGLPLAPRAAKGTGLSVAEEVAGAGNDISRRRECGGGARSGDLAGAARLGGEADRATEAARMAAAPAGPVEMAGAAAAAATPGPGIPKAEASVRSSTAAAPPTLRAALRHPLLLRHVAVLSLALCTLVLSYYGIGFSLSYIPGCSLYLSFFLVSAAEVPSALLVGGLIDRLGRCALVLAGMGVSGAACVGCGLAVGAPAAQVLLAMVGKFGCSSAWSVLVVYCAEVFPTSVRSVLSGAVYQGARAGGVAAPFVFLLGGAAGSGQLPFVLMGALTLAAAVPCVLLPETRGSQQPETLEQLEANSGRTPLAAALAGCAQARESKKSASKLAFVFAGANPVLQPDLHGRNRTLLPCRYMSMLLLVIPLTPAGMVATRAVYSATAPV
ncbi:Solute carrier family 22 member 21 [Tetrabaena socialis]|uniref:Solute carrier family 22 member 21 n=1 Tax=Tetrabaena socialis TaxID=47790 RepID=A0A2J8A4R2_9CHLO|nr:Solute carrier family 22 member 21 [Tetrabaena socialis]|eukprot:PNH07510.1 Solute carrier family 22 member 21 [Tetrabaena socialis]